jgi:hypothetical protein
VTRTEIILIVVVVVALITLLAARGGGPRVTEITRTTRRDKEDGE